jgi:LacI family transcriptional regulator
MKQVTIKDIAEIAGVSFSTVSRCLNDSPNVSAATKQKVLKISKELGFAFNANARSLVNSESKTIGVVLPKNYRDINVNVYHNLLINVLQSKIEEKGYDLLVTYENNKMTGRNNIVRLVSMNKVDGLVLLLENKDDETLAFLKKTNIPVVYAHFPPERKDDDKDIIFTDHFYGGQLVGYNYVSKGLKKFLVIEVIEHHLEFEQRDRGFCDVVLKEGGSVVRLSSNSTFESAHEVVKNNIDKFKDIEGVFCMNDLMALGAMRALQDAGYIIPDDILMTGYDDSEFSHYSKPKLTSIHQPKEDLAYLIGERLFLLINKKKRNEEISPKRISIQPIFMERESSLSSKKE